MELLQWVSNLFMASLSPPPSPHIYLTHTKLYCIQITEYNTFIDKLLVGSAHGMALIVAKGITDFPNKRLPSLPPSSKIDVYWIVKDGGLCLLIAYLLKQNRVWRNTKVCKQEIYTAWLQFKLKQEGLDYRLEC